jgi:hypothetical protein
MQVSHKKSRHKSAPAPANISYKKVFGRGSGKPFSLKKVSPRKIGKIV